MLQRYLLFLLLPALLPLSVHAQSVEFIRNDGQWDGPFSYRASAGRGGEVFLSPSGFTYLLADPVNRERMDAVHHGIIKDKVTLRLHAYRMSFVGASPDAKITASKEQSWYYNYMLGKDEKRWKSNIHPALALDYSAVYPGIDLHVSSKGDLLEYEWMVGEGRDPKAIHMRLDGTDGLKLKGGNLFIKTSVGDVEEMKPVAFQYRNNERKEVPCRYVLSGSELSYDFPDGWDKGLPLIIDPTIVFCSMTGSTADNWGYTATYDNSGNFYAGGIMLSYLGGAYPVTTGAFQTTYGGGVTDPSPTTSDAHGVGYPSDIAIMKFNPSGTTRLWATYLGGSDNEQPHSIVVDNNGNLVIAGVTYSSDYPVTTGCYDNSFNGGADIIVSTLNTTGSALVGSTFIGGTSADGVNYNGSEYIFGNLKHNYGDNARSEVIVDRSNNVYVTASTKSSNFPTTTNGYQRTFGGGLQDAVLMKLNPSLTTLTYSTFLGGSSDDAGYVLALDTAQTHIYVGGGTQSSNFPSTAGTWKTSYQGSTDGYIARFGNSGTYPLQKVTFIGTSGYDQVYGVQVDSANMVYAMGQTLGGTFPVTTGVYSNTGGSQFVIKMDSLLATNVYSTVFGSGTTTATDISPVAFLIDRCENIYISGWGGTLLFTAPGVGTCNGMPVTASIIPPGGVLTSTTDGHDFYFIVLAKNAASLLFAAYHGRNTTDAAQGEHVDGGTSRFDKAGVIYQAICGGCSGLGGSAPAYPTTSGAWSTTNGSSNCNEVALKIAFNYSAPDAIANGNPRARGCPPLLVNFQNLSTNAISQQWNFADGSPLDTSFSPSHTFIRPGVYNVQLIVYNPAACKVRDTAYITVTVDSNRITPGFNYRVTDSCGPFRAFFTNTSVLNTLPGSAGRTSFTWNFGDGTSYTGAAPPIHNFPGSGTYTVVLTMRDSLACNNPDSIKKVVVINGNLVKAVFISPDTVCLRSGLTFINKSTNATGVTWFFGDGQSSTSATTITHTYATFGTYNVMLIAVNPKSCNGRDTLKKTIHISRLPTADFTFVPVIPVPNTPIDFTNRSANADYYAWTYGDGTGSSETNPSHLYRKSGTFIACLKAITNEGCVDSICKSVESDVHTAIDVPTAFSPNGDGSNDILYVRGGGLESMSFMLFNRWGQKVFETNRLDRGWDGTYNGKASPVDAYAFVLTATFIDGTSALKKGNITLLRG